MDPIHIALEESHHRRIAAHGPYTLRADGHIIDVNGVALATLHGPDGEICDWDRAVVAALNEIADACKTT